MTAPPRAYLVDLPGSATPIFPDACVVCGRSGAEPLATFSLSDELGRVDLCFYRLGRDRPSGPVLLMPVHDSCALRFRNGFLRWLLLCVAVALSIVALWSWLQLDAFFGYMAALVASGLLLAFHFRHPSPVELERHGGRLRLVFTDRDYAERVARRNGAEVEERRPQARVLSKKAERGRP